MVDVVKLLKDDGSHVPTVFLVGAVDLGRTPAPDVVSTARNGPQRLARMVIQQQRDKCLASRCSEIEHLRDTVIISVIFHGDTVAHIATQCG